MSILVVKRRLLARDVDLVFAFQTRSRQTENKKKENKLLKRVSKTLQSYDLLHLWKLLLYYIFYYFFCSCFDCPSNILHCASGFFFFRGLQDQSLTNIIVPLIVMLSAFVVKFLLDLKPQGGFLHLLSFSKLNLTMFFYFSIMSIL